MQDIKTRVEKLKEAINRHRYLYHVLDRQEISEAALDSLKHELAELEKQYPNTPALIPRRKELEENRWINSPKSSIKRGSGHSAMLSPKKKLENLTSGSNECWKENRHRMSVWKPTSDVGLEVEYVCELKIDGFKIVLTYENGILQTAATRRRRHCRRRCDAEH